MSSVTQGNMFDDCKTESRSARALAAPLINAEKAFKNAVKLILRYAYARVLNGNCGPSLAAENSYRNLSVPFIVPNCIIALVIN